ncbi:hypothetical protein JL722_10219 [Aureococcus anophagefferens]|nr:hypothetical protein JL722_10219 [Aureococcus anophagefferens]
MRAALPARCSASPTACGPPSRATPARVDDAATGLFVYAVVFGEPAAPGAAARRARDAALAERALAATRSGGCRAGSALELGAGTGLPSLAAARAGAKVLATDRDATSLAYAAAAADDQGLALAAAVFDVADFAPLPPADVVVVADVFVTDAVAAACGRRVGGPAPRLDLRRRRLRASARAASPRAEGFSGAFGASEDPPLLLLDGEYDD